MQVAVDYWNAASISMIKNYLNEGGLFGKVAARKLILSKVNIKKRIIWCKDYRSLSIDEWKNVLFTDECKIEIFSTSRKFVRRSLGQRFNNIYTCKAVRHQFSILVWGLIKGDSSRMLVKCPPRLDLAGYQDILKRRTPGYIHTCIMTSLFLCKTEHNLQ